MSNKPIKIKDPKKVAAGKARAAKALRINGQFVTNFFKDELKKDAEAVGYTGRNLQRFLDQNEDVYSTLYHSGEVRASSPKSDTTVFKDMQGYSGSFVIRRNGEDVQVTKEQMKYEILRVEQALMSNENCAGVAFKPILTYDGKMIIELPDVEEIEELTESGEDLTELMEQGEGMTIYISSKRKDKYEAQKQRKAQRINKDLKNAKQSAKGRTKRRNG